MATGKLDGKAVIMTGGAQGLGLAMALGLAREGANVSLVDIDGDMLAGRSPRLAMRSAASA